MTFRQLAWRGPADAAQGRQASDRIADHGLRTAKGERKPATAELQKGDPLRPGGIQRGGLAAGETRCSTSGGLLEHATWPARKVAPTTLRAGLQKLTVFCAWQTWN